MALKIETNQSATAYHIIDGPVMFPYQVDARHAISNHPLEWRDSPWSASDTAAARAKAGFSEIELTPEEQAAIDEHNRAVAEASERLAAFREKQAEEKKLADQVAADEAIVASAPPRPDPTIRRPFGRKGEPTQAELEQIKKREAKKADDERIAREKVDADALAISNAKVTG